MNFIGDHPLNLIGKVAIVTSASSTAGAAICRALLNSNAFVLGVDRDAAHHSTRSSRASHFQFLRCEVNDPFLSGKILKCIKNNYQREDVDFLINVVGAGNEKWDLEGLVGLVGVLDAMAARNSGLILNVSAGGEGEEEMIKSAKAASSQLKFEGIRCNVLVSHNVKNDHSGDPLFDEATKIALQEHIHEHETRRQNGGYDMEKDRDIANLALFLCTVRGETIRGALIAIDGSCSPF